MILTDLEHLLVEVTQEIVGGSDLDWTDFKNLKGNLAYNAQKSEVRLPEGTGTLFVSATSAKGYSGVEMGGASTSQVEGYAYGSPVFGPDGVPVKRRSTPSPSIP
jgi:hypothetical protein